MRPILLLPLLAAPASAQAWFETPQTFDFEKTGEFRAHGDVDGDGDTDLLFMYGGSQSGTWLSFTPWLNDGGGSFTPGVEVFFPANKSIGSRPVRMGDVNGDGLDDVVEPQLESGERGLLVYLATGAGLFAPPIYLPTDGVPNQIRLADVEGDGVLDIAVQCSISGGANVRWFRWDGVSAFVSSAVADVPEGVESLAAYDFNGDGLADLLAGAWFSGLVYPFPTNLSLNPLPRPPFSVPGVVGSGRSLAAGDLDGDGDDDSVAASFDYDASVTRLWVLENTGAPFPVVHPPQVVPNSVGIFQLRDCELLDWDGDGDLDFANVYEYLVVLENTGGGQFAHGATVDVHWLGEGAGGADFDGDGSMDHAGPRTVKFGNGTFHSVHAPAYQQEINPFEYRVLDWEGDGDLDLLDVHGGVSRNDGSGSYTQLGSQWPPAPPSFKYDEASGIGDFDGDGLADFLVAYDELVPFGTFGTLAEFREMRLLRDDGAGRYVDDGGQVTLGVEISAGTAHATRREPADIDSDGDLDVLVHTGAWLNLGQATGFFTASLGLFAGGSPSHHADLDADGDTDVLSTTGSGSTQSLHLHRNLGALAFQSEVLDFLPSGGIANHSARFFDLDEDGDLDVAIGGTIGLEGRYVRVYENSGGSFGAPQLLYAGNRDGTLLAQVDIDDDGLLDLVGGTDEEDSNGEAVIAFRRSAGLTFEPRRQYVADPIAHWADADGDGDLDAHGETLFRGWTFNGPGAGSIRQYGDGSPGTGGVAPVLGARGPMRVGSSTAALRVRRGQPNAGGLLVIGAAESSGPVVLPGVTQLTDPLLAVFPLQLGPDGRSDGPLAVTAGLAGQTLYFQGFLVDAGAPAFATNTNGLELSFGP